LHIGGAAANTAVWLANFGFSIGLTGNVIGRDSYGEVLWGWLAAHPTLDLSLIRQNSVAKTPFCRALVTPDGERSFLIFGYPQSEKVRLTEAMLRGAKFVALDLYGGEERLEAAVTARAAGAQTIIGDVIHTDHPILPNANIVTNSAAYMRHTNPDTDIRGQAHELQAVTKGIVITTDGPHAVYVVDQSGKSFAVQPPPAKAIDATGAGDAFRAGLLAGLIQGESLTTAVRWACAAGALKVPHLGAATVLPRLAQVVDLADESSSVMAI
jgi:sugar/nucleoside kinase (ribokinase family)